jgi:hypothetical protein
LRNFYIGREHDEIGLAATTKNANPLRSEQGSRELPMPVAPELSSLGKPTNCGLLVTSIAPGDKIAAIKSFQR